MSIRAHAVTAVLRRTLFAYFGNPAGYVFITIFLAATAFLAFSSATFFASNLADFSALNELFLWLPVVFAPAVTMTAWAEERKLSTDELLLTLPVHDIEVVVGKYLGALGVYTVSLAFALSHALVLAWLGDPDAGLIAANFLGYWLVGAALIPLGLVASCLTANITVSFILGAVFCVAAVFAEQAISLALGGESRLARGVSVGAHFENLTLGVVALPDIIYFGLLAASMLYVNVILLGKRHWLGGKHGPDMWRHYVVRGVSVCVAAICISILAGRWLGGMRLDATAERLNSLSKETERLLKDLPGDRPIYIQAYVSAAVPESHVKTRQDMLRLLREFDAIGGGRVFVTVQDTELYSKEAREAEERFEIVPRNVVEVAEGRQGASEVFLGVAVTCGPEEDVIPFMDRGLSVEYELARSVRVVAKANRRKVGILSTDAKLFGGFDFDTMNMQPAWEIVEELKKQYEVVQCMPTTEIDRDIDVLIAALPSSLTQPQMDVLVEHIESGGPALLLVDPLPIQFPELSPSQPKRPPGGAMGARTPPEPKGNIVALLSRIGLAWRNETIVWDSYNPIPRLRDLPPEFVFVSPEAGTPRAFNPDEVMSAGLSRMILMFPGALQKAPGSPLEVAPLLTTGTVAGELQWPEIVQMSWLGVSFRPRRRYVTSGRSYTLAARVSGELPADEDKDQTDEQEDGKAREGKKGGRRLNVIALADLDLISDGFFDLRRHGMKELRFDNITFVLNCVDYLAGDSELIAVRNRLPRYRTLSAIEKKRKTFQEGLLAEEERAEDEAAGELRQAQKRLDDKVEALKARADIDEKTKAIMLEQLERVENNIFQTAESAIGARKDERIKSAELEMHRSVRSIENRVRFWTMVLPPLPAIVIGLGVLMMQMLRERRGSPLTRAMRQNR